MIFQIWLRDRDSNPNFLLQRQACYHYTIPQRLTSGGEIISNVQPQKKSDTLFGMIELNFFFFLGRPGAGKDTVANRLVDELPDAFKEGTGDIYYSAKDKKGKYAHLHSVLAPYIELVDKEGGLIPDEPITEIVRMVIEEAVTEGSRNFVFTGYPRTIDQFRLIDQTLHEMREEGYEIEDNFLEIKVTETTALARSKERYDEAIGRGEKPKDVDKPEVRRKRMMTYLEQTQPLIDVLRQEGRLITIDGEPNKETVAEITLQHVGKERVG